MADNLSPLVNLDLINQIYKTINAQITERVHNPKYNSEATLGTSDYKYKSAWIENNTSTGTLNYLTLTKASTGFTISGGDTSKTLTVGDTATIAKPLTVDAKTSITGALTVSAATNIIKSLTVGAADTGAVTIKSGGTGDTTIIGPNSGTANLIKGEYTDSATTKNNTTPTKDQLLKITEVNTKLFLAGPTTGSAAVPEYRSIIASDLPEADGGRTGGIVNTGTQTFEGAKTFNDTTDGNTDFTKGAVVIKGGLSVAKNIYAKAVHNAIWNDLVDCMEVPENTSLEYGYCYSWKGSSVVRSSYSSKNCIGIHSNTAGFAMGEKKTETVRAAVAGFVLAYVDRLYPEGTPLTWGDNGVLTKCSSLKRILHPERIIATFYREEKEEKWHDLPVSGRHWVKVR